MMDPNSKSELLAHYATREPKLFYQYDGFVVGKDSRDDVMRPDADGDSLWGGQTHELMYGADMRCLINPKASKEDILRLLKKITEWVEGDGLTVVERPPGRPSGPGGLEVQ